MVFQREEKVIFAQNIGIFVGEFNGAVELIQLACFIHFGAEAGGDSDEALAVFPEERLVDAGLVIEALERGQRDEFDEVVIALLRFGEQHQMHVITLGGFFLHAEARDVDLAPYDGFEAGRVGVFIELDRSVQHSVIGNGQMFHPHVGRGLHGFLNFYRAIEQAIAGMEM